MTTDITINDLSHLVLAPRPNKRMPYEEAVLYCQFLEYNGHNDWRLPTYEEWILLPSIYNDDWHLDRYSVNHLWCVTPVRNID